MADPVFYFHANSSIPAAVECAQKWGEVFASHGARIAAPGWMAELLPFAQMQDAPPKNCVALVFGGDGTLLRFVPEAARSFARVLGVRTGHLGFLMAADRSDAERCAELLTRGDFAEVSRPLLETQIGGETLLALNDLCVLRGTQQGAITLTVEADGDKMFTMRGDGLVVSTPTGSTGYAMSAGGPIVRPDSPTTLVVPICAPQPSARSTVLPDSVLLRVFMAPDMRDGAVLSADGQKTMPFPPGASAVIRQSTLTFSLIRTVDQSRFFETLRKKRALDL